MRSYRRNDGNIYNPQVFNFNHIKNNNTKKIYTNLRYLNNDGIDKDNYNRINDNNGLTDRNYSKIFSKAENFKIQKDRLQKFHLNNSASTINVDKRILHPIYISSKKNDNEINLKQMFHNRIKNNLNNFDKEEKSNNEKNLILSQNDIYKNNNYRNMNILDKFTLFPKYHYIYNKFNGRKRTDITNNEIWDKYQPGNNQDYIDYIYKNKEVDLFNKRFLENKNNIKILEKNQIIDKERNLMKEKNEYFKRVMIKDALYNKKKIKYYKNELDNQMEHFLENKLLNENMEYNQFLKNKDYNRLKTPIMKYLNQNDFFDVNPYSHRSLNLGKSNLKYDTLLNPKIQFKTNKYIFPEIVNNNYSTIQ